MALSQTCDVHRLQGLLFIIQEDMVSADNLTGLLVRIMPPSPAAAAAPPAPVRELSRSSHASSVSSGPSAASAATSPRAMPLSSPLPPRSPLPAEEGGRFSMKEPTLDRDVRELAPSRFAALAPQTAAAVDIADADADADADTASAAAANAAAAARAAMAEPTRLPARGVGSAMDSGADAEAVANPTSPVPLSPPKLALKPAKASTPSRRDEAASSPAGGATVHTSRGSSKRVSSGIAALIQKLESTETVRDTGSS